MRIKNTTKIPDQLVREVINFVKPSGITNFDVMVKNAEWGLAGKAYSQGSSYHATANPFIVCRIPETKYVITKVINGNPVREKRNKYPCILNTYQIGHLKGKEYYLADTTEALVYLAAHELRHLWQAKAKSKRGYNWGSRGKFSEIDTESYAIRMLRAWRKKIKN